MGFVLFGRLIMKKRNEYSLAKYACYISSASMATVICLSPILFATLRDMYGISYTLLGLLVVANFSTQLIIDLVFTFFSKYFNIHKTLRIMPVLTFVGLLIYGLMPMLFPKTVYLWLALSTVVFSVSAGLGEVLLSPVFAKIPAENPEREMSKLHSGYAWGVVGVTVVSTVFLKLVGTENWTYLALLWSLLPLLGAVLFQLAKLPDMTEEAEEEKPKEKLFSTGVILCLLCIFMGGATECTMNQWISGFMEKAVGIDKVVGDVFGMALFAVLLGTGRSLYAKYGKNILNVMLIGMIISSVCYILAGVSLNPIVSLVACVVTGISASMLWPGTIICVGEKFKAAGVAVYALMAAGGDAGASFAPQLVGIVADNVAVSDFAVSLAQKLYITPEQVGIRTAIFLSAVFPIIGIVLVCVMRKYFKKNKE